jgi:hypothetical protein
MKTGIAYFYSRDPRHAERDLDDMLEHGCNYVVHCYSELDMAYYNQAMERIIRLTKDRGMEVYLDPWGVGGVFGGETFSKFVIERLEARQVDVNGHVVPAACPNHPKFRELMGMWIQRAADLGADVCFWDEPHFYYDFVYSSSWENWACRCETCRALYRAEAGAEMPSEMTREVEGFRRRAMLGFLRENCREARGLGMRNCVCVLPDEGGSLGKVAGTAGWDEIAALPEVDIFGTDPYWALFGGEVEEFVGRYCRRVVDLCKRHGKEAQAWVLAFLITEDREAEVGRAAEVIYESGIRNIAAWAYRGSHLIDIRSTNPEKVWDVLGGAYRRLRAREERA